jgi:hypothetical protein
MALKHFIKDKYESLGEALLDIRNELQRLQPVDSGSIAWEQTATGMSAHIGDGGMGGSMPTEASSDEGAASISGVSAYNGYFKIVDMTTTDENGVTVYKVGVVDGATYNAETGTSGDSVVRVNGHQALVPATVFEPDETDTQYFILLEYTWATDDVCLVQYDSLPEQDDAILYLQIGRYFITDGTLKIEQWATESGAYALQNEYTGVFKLYRYYTEGGSSVYGMMGGWSDAAGYISSDTDIDWEGPVYVNFTVADENTQDITAEISSKYLDIDDGVSVLVGYVNDDGTVTQTLTNNITLAGRYVI